MDSRLRGNDAGDLGEVGGNGNDKIGSVGLNVD
jgi:hypothetical protein